MLALLLRSLAERLREVVEDIRLKNAGCNFVPPKIHIGLKQSKSKNDYPLIYIIPTGFRLKKNELLAEIALITGVYIDAKNDKDKSEFDPALWELLNLGSTILRVLCKRSIIDNQYTIDTDDISYICDLKSNQPFYLAEVDISIKTPFII